MSDDQAVIEFATAGCKTMADDTLRLQIDIEPRFADRAFELFGKRGIQGAIVRLNLDHAAHEDRADQAEYGQFWSDLFRSGFFRSPEVLRAIGPEGDFENWIRDQPSVIDGDMDIVLDQASSEHKRRNQCCHVRRVSRGAGTGAKPPYFAVSMTASQHAMQHTKGEAAVLERYRDMYFRDSRNTHAAEVAKDWFTRRADRLQTEWASWTLVGALATNPASRSEVSPGLVRGWARGHDLERFLPAAWREG